MVFESHQLTAAAESPKARHPNRDSADIYSGANQSANRQLKAKRSPETTFSQVNQWHIAGLTVAQFVCHQMIVIKF